jgi:hypothetical protein
MYADFGPKLTCFSVFAAFLGPIREPLTKSNVLNGVAAAHSPQDLNGTCNKNMEKNDFWNAVENMVGGFQGCLWTT